MTVPSLHIVITVPQSMNTQLPNHPRQLSDLFDVTLVASPGADLEASGTRGEALRQPTYQSTVCRNPAENPNGSNIGEEAE